MGPNVLPFINKDDSTHTPDRWQTKSFRDPNSFYTLVPLSLRVWQVTQIWWQICTNALTLPCQDPFLTSNIPFVRLLVGQIAACVCESEQSQEPPCGKSALTQYKALISPAHQLQRVICYLIRQLDKRGQVCLEQFQKICVREVLICCSRLLENIKLKKKSSKFEVSHMDISIS